MSARGEIARLLVPLALANLAAWAAAFAVFHGDAVLMGAALLAYTLGLRHAVDADHIAAIDNVTRKLVQEGKRPTATGLYFSLGHSAVVWLAAIGIALAAGAMGPRLDLLRHIGGAFGTAISVLFLFAIAAANLAVLAGIVAAVRRHRDGEAPAHAGLNNLLAPRGLYTRLLAPLFACVSQSRHMFAIGFLFGLGFDTASEIGVLGLSAAGAGHGMPIWSVLIFPALFTAGMSAVDTLDSGLMTHAYGWALVAPARKLYYNLAVTFLSVVVAVVVGGVEAASLLGPHLDAGNLGYGIVAAFAGLWLAALFMHRRAARASA